MEWFRIYGDFLSNIFSFLALDLFINKYSVCIPKNKQFSTKIFFGILWGIFSIIPSIPYFTYIRILVDFLYIIFITKTTILKRILILMKFNIYYYIFTLLFAIIHTLLTLDLPIFATNSVYAGYTNILDCFLLYIVLCMHIIIKQLSNFPTGKMYKRYFLAITSVIILMLIVCSMFLGSTILKQEDTVPLFFSLLLVITLLCISIYRKVVTVLEENMLSKIETEKNALQQNYSASVEENLKKLSILRHDFKNHLLVLQGYAVSERKTELLEYIQTLTTELSGATLINTPSPLLSSLVNAKKADCERKNVSLDFQWDFSTINITDFNLVTILTNLLDNALSASSKLGNGFIKLSVFEKGTYLEIDCINNHQEKIQKKEHVFLTTKTDHPEIHGLGLISVRRAVESLHGELLIDYTEDMFHINILVPNYI